MNFHLKLKILYFMLTTKNRIFLIGAPFHSNMGDQAQTFCTEKWISKNYPTHKIFVLNSIQANIKDYFVLKLIKKHIKSNDKVFLHSGYHTTDIYLFEEKLNRFCVNLFKDNQIIVLPQTVYFEDVEESKKSEEIYKSHKNIIFLARDEISFQSANDLFSDCTVKLFPDIVTTLIGTKKYANKREGLLFCMRNDKERVYSEQVMKDFMNKYAKNMMVSLTDTTIDAKPAYINRNRKKILENMFDKFSTYKAVVTDRYHGTIFSLISNTPVIVLGTADHKLSSGVKWFPQEFDNYVFYADNLIEAENYINYVLAKEYKYDLPQYFNEKYYNNLKNIIDNGIKQTKRQ